METPNIFRYARSSTLNIAMVGWILDHIDCEGNLKQLGLDFIKLISKNEIENIQKIKVLNMYKNIALVVEINDDYVITLEDITFAKNQCNILKKHRELILKDEAYLNRKKLFVYIHIGNRMKCENKDEISSFVRRDDILNILSGYRNTENELLEDYIRYLEVIGEYTDRYKASPEFKYWHRLTWEGYFNSFKERVSNEALEWDYSSSQNGDLISFWWDKKNKKYKTNLDTELDYNIYLQIETELPCKYNYEEHEYMPYLLFKVEVDDSKYKSEIRNYVWSKLEQIKEKYEKRGLDIEKTSHAIGKYMTIGKIGNIKTLEDLEKYITISSELIQELNTIC